MEKTVQEHSNNNKQHFFVDLQLLEGDKALNIRHYFKTEEEKQDFVNLLKGVK